MYPLNESLEFKFRYASAIDIGFIVIEQTYCTELRSFQLYFVLCGPGFSLIPYFVVFENIPLLNTEKFMLFVPLGFCQIVACVLQTPLGYYHSPVPYIELCNKPSRDS